MFTDDAIEICYHHITVQIFQCMHKQCRRLRNDPVIGIQKLHIFALCEIERQISCR